MEGGILAIGRSFERGCLRSLRPEDADGMLEWMGDPDVAGVFRADFGSFDRDDALAFIRGSWEDGCSLHFAVSGHGGEYLGTVSLKEVDHANSCAEYAIAMRSKAHGTGAAAEATRDVVSYAFDELGLHRVYLNVRADNLRAMRFYDKMGFVREGVARGAVRTRAGGGRSSTSSGTRRSPGRSCRCGFAPQPDGSSRPSLSARALGGFS